MPTIMILLFELSGCQTVITDETSTASPVVPVVTEGPSGAPHEMEGHEDCIKCHFSEDEVRSDGALASEPYDLRARGRYSYTPEKR